MAASRLNPAAQLAALALAAAVLGTLAQAFAPTRIPWREDWSAHVQTKALKLGLALAETADAQTLSASGHALLIDARGAKDYDAGRLPGALSLPDSQRTEIYPLFADLFTPGQTLLIYCSGKTCDESLNLCLFLREQGHTNLVLYVGGYHAWQEAGLPVER
ncbi:MAG TPA: rhodanese-like domain-containing protein [Kiritimatiellia bacterium]|nr:rhodanese-like domain-containing protein [Kiritimatiellia bacterium]